MNMIIFHSVELPGGGMKLLDVSFLARRKDLGIPGEKEMCVMSDIIYSLYS